MNKEIDKTKIAETISKNIQILMKENNLSVEEFAKKTELNYHRVKSLLEKTAKRLRILDVLQIVFAFNVSSDWFLGQESVIEH